ncbi:hypothetical protein Acy02nite_10220 [Actinoplanes cyaneus]|uniref:Uncharacterized protein n=1 Tax=Actinoplanes cyaneus TaxID=52696 RepID=A0A919M9L0_9ACTN|nr:hypothetical protein [Actinoplanes cyaneus]MCW2137091.1 hypothetical protein [Actinoplanes cyaneus]GID63141.1 hypothetical protein Acy02nite_10220 [Actinoplanes cyaneus]
MVKFGTPANYYVRVRFAGWEDEPERSALYRGVYTVTLNMLPEFTFVDDLSRLGPPWLESSLPPEEDGDLTDPEMVRLALLLHSWYTVTPNVALAGRTERFIRPWAWEDQQQAVVFYVSPAEFAVLLDDLAALADTEAGNVHSVVRRDKVLDHPVIRFIEDRVLTSPLLDPRDLRSAGRTEASKHPEDL